MKNSIGALLIALIGGSIMMFVIMIILFPLVAIWSINTLFPQAALDYSFWSWLAIIGLKLVFGSFASLKMKTETTSLPRKR